MVVAGKLKHCERINTMENNSTSATASAGLRGPVALTAEQSAAVSGGVVISPISPIGHGCLTCTSGVMQAFQAQADRLK